MRDEFADVPQQRRQFGAANGTSLAVAREKQGLVDGSTVSAIRWREGPAQFILLHGGGLNAHSWDSVAITMGQPIIVPDLPGHGHSSWRNDFDYRPPSLAKALLSWMENACPEPVHVVGQSLGGLAAVELAALAGDRVRSVTVVDITPGRSAESTGGRNIRHFVEGAKRFDTYDDLIEHALSSGIGTNRRTLERGLIHNTRVTMDGRIMFRHHFASAPEGALVPYDIVPIWATIQGLSQPVQLVRGSRGIVDGPQVEEFLRRRPGAPVAVLEAGHNVQRDAPVELAHVITDFASGISQ